MQGAQPGSSAGGEQPKFSAVVQGHAVLVKFSPAGDSPSDQRSRDLLVCEHLALHTLAQAGLPAAQTQIVMADGRVFLQSQRFDRTAKGRIGMVSLQVYDAEYVGEMDNWAATANRMAARRLLTDNDARTLRLLDAFVALHDGKLRGLEALEGSVSVARCTLCVEGVTAPITPQGA